MTRRIIYLLTSWALAWTAPVLAQTWKDGPHLGWVGGGDAEDPDIAVGWQASYEFNDLASLDLSVTRQTDTLTSQTVPLPSLPDLGGFDEILWAFALSARAGTLVGDRVYVYGGGGVGYYWFNTDNEPVRRTLAASSLPGRRGGTVENVEMKVDKDFGFHLAGGLEYHLFDAWEIFVEYRWVWLSPDADITVVERVPSADPGKSLFTDKFRRSFDYNYGLLRVGINYRF